MRMKACVGDNSLFRPFRVVLGDSMQKVFSGGGKSCTLRERVLNLHEADVIIDSRAPIIHEVLAWANKVSGVSRTPAPGVCVGDGDAVGAFERSVFERSAF